MVGVSNDSFAMTETRVFQFYPGFDAYLLFVPICIFGAVTNSFLVRFLVNFKTFFKTCFTIVQYWILSTKAELATCINAMIRLFVLSQIFVCTFGFGFKLWIFSISPMLGLFNRPSPGQCQIGRHLHCSFWCYKSGLILFTFFEGMMLSAIAGMGPTIFNLLAFVVR